MNLARISFSYLQASDRSTLLTIVLFAFGVAAITLLGLTARQLEARMSGDAQGVDVVVGAKGSAEQLVLGAVYQLDVSAPAFSWTQAHEITLKAEVARAIPIVNGESYRSFPVVGTTHDYVTRYGPSLSLGRMWDKPLEAVVGAAVASRTGLRVGQAFTPAHPEHAGLESGRVGLSYKVVGELKRTDTGLDYVIVTALESVWMQQAQDDDGLVAEPRADERRPVNAILVRAASAEGAAELMRETNAQSELQAVSPRAAAARFFSVVSAGIEALRALAVLLVVGAGVCVFFALYGALSHRRYDLAIMRALGASPRQIMLVLLLEGMLVAGIGSIVGLVLGHLATSVLGFSLRAHHVGLTGWTWSVYEFWIVAGAIGAGFLAALVPAWLAHETDIATTLARG